MKVYKIMIRHGDVYSYLTKNWDRANRQSPNRPLQQRSLLPQNPFHRQPTQNISMRSHQPVKDLIPCKTRGQQRRQLIGHANVLRRGLVRGGGEIGRVVNDGLKKQRRRHRRETAHIGMFLQQLVRDQSGTRSDRLDGHFDAPDHSAIINKRSTTSFLTCLSLSCFSDHPTFLAIFSYQFWPHI